MQLLRYNFPKKIEPPAPLIEVKNISDILSFNAILYVYSNLSKRILILFLIMSPWASYNGNLFCFYQQIKNNKTFYLGNIFLLLYPKL